MSKPMTKTQLVAALAEEMGADKKSAGAALDAICGIITREVSGGGAVTLPGVGKSNAVNVQSAWCATHQLANSSKNQLTKLLK